MPMIGTDENTVTSIDWQQTNLYRFFALVFAPPTHECFIFLAQPAVSTALCDLWKLLECEGKAPGFEWFSSYELYESAYIALFDVGAPEPPVPLFESAHDKSHPAQEIALENTDFYEVLGLKPDTSRAVPDYLVSQSEFLAAIRYTCENATDEATAVSDGRRQSSCSATYRTGCLRQRASWTEPVRLDFPVVMTLLVQFLSHRHEGAVCELPRISPARDHLP